MGFICASVVADLFLFGYEKYLSTFLPIDKQADVIDAFPDIRTIF